MLSTNRTIMGGSVSSRISSSALLSCCTGGIGASCSGPLQPSATNDGGDSVAAPSGGASCWGQAMLPCCVAAALAGAAGAPCIDCSCCGSGHAAPAAFTTGRTSTAPLRNMMLPGRSWRASAAGGCSGLPRWLVARRIEITCCRAPASLEGRRPPVAAFRQ